MCGIVGYIGTMRVVPILLEGLRRLEYRGYDSAGIAYLLDGQLHRHRATGKLDQLVKGVDNYIGEASTIGLGHTRWATHGGPSEDNAHPHLDCSGKLVVVHNGIIENYNTLKDELISKGHTFTSETDTEVLAHLIEENLHDGDLVMAVRKALSRVEGAYALGVLWADEPDLLVAARNHSPLVMGVGDEACYIASDIPALLPYTREIILLDDGELAILRREEYSVIRIKEGNTLDKRPTTIEWNAAMAEKAGYRHFMLKEIYEQPQSILNTVRGRIYPDSGKLDLSEIGLDIQQIKNIDRIALVACGTSWHAALVGKYWLEKWVGVPVEVDIASEFRYRRLLVNERTLTIAISQSGETADTLASIRRARTQGSKVLTICNVVGATMTRESDGVLYTHAGPEIGVASTKAFTSQLAALFLLTLYLGQETGSLPIDEQRYLGQALINVAAVMNSELPRLQKEIAALTEQYHEAKDFLFIGRGLSYPIALEGALKLKEISYIHAEGYAAGELKHGPIALIDKDMPVLALVPQDAVYLKAISNVEEIKARQGRLILVGSNVDTHLKNLTEDRIVLPEVDEAVNPLLYSLPVQLLAYEIANRRGCDVDQPRNLAKSVTVE